MVDRDVMRRAEEIAAGITWQPLGPPKVPTAAELSAAFTRAAGEPVEVTDARLDGDVIHCSVRMPIYSVAVSLGLPCPCGSGQLAGGCSICDAYPWDPPASRSTFSMINPITVTIIISGGNDPTPRERSFKQSPEVLDFAAAIAADLQQSAKAEIERRSVDPK